ncbi:hypothetical protein AK830_g4373 [Neonectria ditissima]|uniref:Ig-like domain-containing protein n=1 Tax=Neonectria ditissima TaxID=78410 RepID=A0A0P7AW49_9HYPO|nr:hypothetical protein AK830_g4373 [Neonectria ditissima]
MGLRSLLLLAFAAGISSARLCAPDASASSASTTSTSTLSTSSSSTTTSATSSPTSCPALDNVCYSTFTIKCNLHYDGPPLFGAYGLLSWQKSSNGCYLGNVNAPVTSEIEDEDWVSGYAGTC